MIRNKHNRQLLEEALDNGENCVKAEIKAYDEIHESRKDAVRKLLRSLPEERGREGLIDTPKRVANMYDEIFEGYLLNPADILSTRFSIPDEARRDIVIVKDIQFYSICEHHMLPFFGKVHVGYIPGKQVVGLSKIGRLVDCYAKRLQIQERLTMQIANDLHRYLNTEGVIVMVEAEHLCMSMRGLQKPGTKTVTYHYLGKFQKSEMRQEFMSMLKEN